MEIDWIQELENYRAAKSLKKAAMARMFGVESQNYNNWVYRGSLPKEFVEQARAIVFSKSRSDNVVNIQEGKGKYLVEGVVSIPRLNVSASMGSGALYQEDHIDVIENMSVNLEYLRRTVSFSKTSNLAIITAYGDSMEGTFSDGDLLLVDRGVNDIKLDAVYVLSLADELYIKRIQRRPDGTFLMLSDNSKYPPYEIRNGEAEKFEVLARVLLAWNARRL
ncbi:MAG: S24 family peptidase [Pseudohongiellaceae bacterium]|nr:S24 family peptidase [Pseudohongiellaceae bacterium]